MKYQKLQLLQMPLNQQETLELMHFHHKKSTATSLGFLIYNRRRTKVLMLYQPIYILRSLSLLDELLFSYTLLQIYLQKSIFLYNLLKVEKNQYHLLTLLKKQQ